MTAKKSSDALLPVRNPGPLKIWFSSHVSTGLAALGRLSRQPFASLMTVLVIAVTLALPAALHLLIKNGESISGSLESALDFSVYLNSDVSRESAEQLVTIIEQRADVAAGGIPDGGRHDLHTVAACREDLA